MLKILVPPILVAAAAHGQSPEAREMHRLHSAHRARHGLEPQILSPRLCNAAATWSDTMRRTGYRHSGMNIRENIARGYGSGNTALHGWIRSAGHNRNLLSDASHVGFGQSGRFFTSLHGGDVTPKRATTQRVVSNRGNKTRRFRRSANKSRKFRPLQRWRRR